MTTMGKMDTSDLMNEPVQHMQLYICKEVIERINPILDTLATWYTRQAFFVLNACE